MVETLYSSKEDLSSLPKIKEDDRQRYLLSELGLDSDILKAIDNENMSEVVSVAKEQDPKWYETTVKKFWESIDWYISSIYKTDTRFPEINLEAEAKEITKERKWFFTRFKK